MSVSAMMSVLDSIPRLHVIDRHVVARPDHGLSPSRITSSRRIVRFSSPASIPDKSVCAIKSSAFHLREAELVALTSGPMS